MAEAAGWLRESFFIFLSFLALGSESLLVIINEFGQGRTGNGEWAELLVVGTGPCSTVDMRGWILCDRQGNATGGIYVTLSSHSDWAAVPAGTLIVIYNHTDTGNLPTHFPSDDFDFSDYKVVMPANAAGYFTTSRWEGISNTMDLIQVLTSTGTLVDGISHGDGLPVGKRQTPHLGTAGSNKAA